MISLEHLYSLESEIKSALGEVQKKLVTVCAGSADNKEIDNISERLNYAKVKIRLMELELRQIQDRQDGRKFRPIVKSFEDQVQEYNQQLLWAIGGKRITQAERLREKYGMI
ncbi:hypothetical protein RFI_10848 [Reticulomyxa filosa]|uniref:Uncharacterized protein n=1 Tax=Reticulomyxa filosa TaxID=46433 RepID=X6NK52_RETFI|nr:hypothetical protein RFI_10848 [Reticulomyxa filosa]|eukprot:ETO26288.1 hypothetical protein RFI_10848 [Reticulomyxa filosa]